MSFRDEQDLPVAHGLMTPSDGEYIAQLCQETSVAGLAESIPANGAVLDLGAGKSNLGISIAAMRPDVTVVALDIQYERKAEQLKQQRLLAPPNIGYITAAASRLPFRSGVFDQDFSYNLISHIMRDDQHLGRFILESALTSLKSDGKMWVGPTNAKIATGDRWGMALLPAEASEYRVDEVLALLTSPPSAGRVYRAMARSGVGIYPRERLEGHGKKGKLLSDPDTETYHRLMTVHGAHLAFRLAKELVR